jgi:Leucine-rich repeat (LRR) protein
MKDKKLIAIFVSLFLIQIGVYTLLHLWNIKHEPIDNSDFKKDYPNYRTLKKIDLSYKDLKKIPSELSVMNSLEAINLGGNYLTEINLHRISPSVQKLYLAGNQINNLQFYSDIFFEESNLKVLDLSNNLLKNYPYALHKFPYLEMLNLSENNISKFDNDIAVPLESLKSFHISTNFFSISDINMGLIFPNLKQSN